ncbi:MAG: 23S rRNA (adenine(2503)-C(2))-methyltransferase RlmN [Thermoanaerobaculia bacterium]|nr:23S rRNA (adenine(2503)-C(2))-methyltransferase RlmN [Thermoanaerobaculia bacterium]
MGTPERGAAEERRTSLYDVHPDKIDRVLGDILSPPFRVRQVADWLYDKHVSTFESMSNLPKPARETLEEHFALHTLEPLTVSEPVADGSRKYLFSLGDGLEVESVYMPMGDRTTICVSSQAGCAVGCTFCVTGFFGPGRNLRPSEILAQIHTIQHEQEIPDEKLNLVFMGMGEPLLNTENLGTTLDILEKSISLKRVTISTSGITPGIRWLVERRSRPNLAISVNAPDQERRVEIMPISRKYPLAELVEELRGFPVDRSRHLTAEYVLLRGWNDSVGDARMLAELLRGLEIKINVIPFNPDPHLPKWMKRPDDAAIDRFAKTLVDEGALVTVRRSKGLEIAAACGQLKGSTKRRKSR